MKKDKLKAFKSAIKIKEGYGLSDDEMDAYTIPLIQKRDKDYRVKVINRYGREVYTDASRWWRDLSPREQRAAGSSAEEICRSYLNADPYKKVSGHDLEKALGKDQYKAPIHDESYDEIPDPDRDEEGRLVPGRKIRIAKAPPRQPSPQELSKMSVREIADLIVKTRDTLWPKGGGGEEIAGLDGVGKER